MLIREGHNLILSFYFVTTFASLMKAQVSTLGKLVKLKQIQFVHWNLFSLRYLKAGLREAKQHKFIYR